MTDDSMSRYLWLTFDEATVIAGLLWRMAHSTESGFTPLAEKYEELLIARSTPEGSGDLVVAEEAALAAGDVTPGARLEVLTGRYLALRAGLEATRQEATEARDRAHVSRVEARAARAEARAARIEARHVRGVLRQVGALLGDAGPVDLTADDGALTRARQALRSVA
jgi:hypothetical protein